MTPEKRANEIVEHFSECEVDRANPLNNVKNDVRITAPLSLLELRLLITAAIRADRKGRGSIGR